MENEKERDVADGNGIKTVQVTFRCPVGTLMLLDEISQKQGWDRRKGILIGVMMFAGRHPHQRPADLESWRQWEKGLSGIEPDI